MRRFRFVLSGVLALALVVPLAACGGGDDDDNGEPTASASSGPPLSDEAYLKVFCTGVTNYQEALTTATSEDAIGKVIQDYVSSLRAVNPPEDLREYHAEYIAYLESALEDPTSLTTKPPPLPGDSVRDRLARKVADIEECKYPTFLEQSTE
ncbi:MAG: hypothetical protein ACM3S1_05465 [Hyphomicrobiales bacterium]